jgi:hypothetical protein
MIAVVILAFGPIRSITRHWIPLSGRGVAAARRLLSHMGFWKERQLEQDELGLSAPMGYYVCDRCLDDYALEALIRRQATELECSFCGRRESAPIAADSDQILEHIAMCVHRQWDSPEAVLYHDPESESGYAGEVLAFSDVLGQEGEWPFANDAFEEFVIDAFRESAWTGRDPAALTENEALRLSWRQFKDTVKHKARFLFLLLGGPADEDDPGAPVRLGGAMLEELGKQINRHGLLADLPEGTTLHRIRVHDPGEHPETAKALGTPPDQLARQSRMSPAGIAMFYGSTDEETAYAETVTPDVKAATAATFTTTRAATIVDLDNLPMVPSLFDDRTDAIENRPSLGFMAGFRSDVSAQIERDDRIHIEYVPTQVVSEYIRHMFRDPAGQPVVGLAWQSAQHGGGRNIVLFVENAWCLESGEPPPTGLSGESKLALRLASRARLLEDLGGHR